MENSEKWKDLPEGFSVRSAAKEDKEEITHLIDTCSIDMLGVPETSFDEIDLLWSTPKFKLETDTRVVLNAQNEYVGYAEVWDINTPPVHPISWARVRPDHRNRGIGSAIMSWSIKRAKHAIPRVPKEARVAMRSLITHSHTAGKKLLEAVGMIWIRHSFRMVIDLDSHLPTPQWPNGISLRTYQHERDVEDVYRAETEAFHDHWGFVDQPFEEGFERWLHNITENEEHDPNLWFLAMKRDQIAGAVLCRAKTYEDPEMGWVYSLFVRRPWRRQGIALALLHHAFRELKQRGKLRAGLGVDAQNLTGATTLYKKAGMRVQRQYDLYEMELRPGLELGKE